MEELTIICLEAMWDHTYKSGNGWRPQSSVQPYILAHSTLWGFNLIYRQIRTEADFIAWTKATQSAHLKTRLIWISGHGENCDDEYVVMMPRYNWERSETRLRPKCIRDGLSFAGQNLGGVIVDSCSFGNNKPNSWISDNDQWALAYSKDVDWTCSVMYDLLCLEWIYSNGYPRTSQDAASCYRRGLQTGGEWKKKDRIDLSSLAEALGANFYYRKSGGGLRKIWVQGGKPIDEKAL